MHECGRTSLHKIKGQKTHAPAIAFGEAVMFKLPATKRRVGDFEDRFEKGIWLGMTVRSQEHLIGTDIGVFRVGKVLRCAPDQRWSLEMIKGIKGTPDEPKPGVKSDRIPVYVKHPEHGLQDRTAEKTFEIPPETSMPTLRAANIYKNDVEEHGPSEGCKACAAIF